MWGRWWWRWMLWHPSENEWTHCINKYFLNPLLILNDHPLNVYSIHFFFFSKQPGKVRRIYMNVLFWTLCSCFHTQVSKRADEAHRVINPLWCGNSLRGAPTIADVLQIKFSFLFTWIQGGNDIIRYERNKWMCMEMRAPHFTLREQGWIVLGETK